MKNLLIGINAKYIHPNLAIRLLKKNTTYETDIIEFTIKDSKEKIVSFIFDNHYDIVGFSCYIWNINLIKEILKELQNKNVIIILGGPEVSYNANYYLDNNLCNYVLNNEGEEAYHLLLAYLDNKYDIAEVPNLYHKNGFTYHKLVDLKKSIMAYDLLPDIKNRIMYIETSRGCPYKCSYCLASLDNKVRFFDIEEIKNQLLILLKKGAKIFKFLDRTFNINKNHFIQLIDFIIMNHTPNSSFQFEITGDLLNTNLIEYLNINAPKKLFRFEIGIQSTNNMTNLAVNRKQDNDKLFNNIIAIQNADIIDLHLDLIAGLPMEDYNSFKKTFNDVLALRPKELQLGFLKLLHGTNLIKEAQQYGYIWNDLAPYEIIQNDFLTIDDLKKIHLVEDTLEKYYNTDYLKESINFILNYNDNFFDFFYDFGLYYIENRKCNLNNLFKLLDDYLKKTNFLKYDEIHILLIKNYLEYHKIKPIAWWNHNISPKEKNDILRLLSAENKINIPLSKLYKYSMVITYKNTIIVAIYLPNESIIKVFK